MQLQIPRDLIANVAPNTPKKKPAVSFGTPTKRSPRCPHCDHENVAGLERHTNAMGHFNATHSQKMMCWPKECAACEVQFVDKIPAIEEEGKQCHRVSNATPVCLCKSGTNAKDSCCFGLCLHCRREKTGASPKSHDG